VLSTTEIRTRPAKEPLALREDQKSARDNQRAAVEDELAVPAKAPDVRRPVGRPVAQAAVSRSPATFGPIASAMAMTPDSGRSITVKSAILPASS
jgi:hypothetical protein